MRNFFIIFGAVFLMGCISQPASSTKTYWSPPPQTPLLTLEVGNDEWVRKVWMQDEWWMADCVEDWAYIRIRGNKRDSKGRLIPSAYRLGHEMLHLLYPDLSDEELLKLD